MPPEAVAVGVSASVGLATGTVLVGACTVDVSVGFADCVEVLIRVEVIVTLAIAVFVAGVDVVVVVVVLTVVGVLVRKITGGTVGGVINVGNTVGTSVGTVCPNGLALDSFTPKNARVSNARIIAVVNPVFVFPIYPPFLFNELPHGLVWHNNVPYYFD